MSMLEIHNDGPLITRTNYWETELAAAGKIYVSINAGALRLLLPPSQEMALEEMRAARECVVSRGPWPQMALDDACEILFDDHSDAPYALHLSIESFDRLPVDSDAGRQGLLTVWTAPRRNRPHKALQRRCYYRRVARIPDLTPWQSKDNRP